LALEVSVGDDVKQILKEEVQDPMHPPAQEVSEEVMEVLEAKPQPLPHLLAVDMASLEGMVVTEDLVGMEDKEGMVDLEDREGTEFTQEVMASEVLDTEVTLAEVSEVLVDPVRVKARARVRATAQAAISSGGGDLQVIFLHRKFPRRL